jgi:hypothetical protein
MMLPQFNIDLLSIFHHRVHFICDGVFGGGDDRHGLHFRSLLLQ